MKKINNKGNHARPINQVVQEYIFNYVINEIGFSFPHKYRHIKGYGFKDIYLKLAKKTGFKQSDIQRVFVNKYRKWYKFEYEIVESLDCTSKSIWNENPYRTKKISAEQAIENLRSKEFLL